MLQASGAEEGATGRLMKSRSQEARALQLKMKQTVTDPCYFPHAGPARSRTAANHIVRVAENQPARRLHLPPLPQGAADRNVSLETRYTQAVLKNNFLLALGWQHKNRRGKKKEKKSMRQQVLLVLYNVPRH